MLYKQLLHSKDILLEAISADILNSEDDPHRSSLKIDTTKPTKTTITCRVRICSFRCEFNRKKNKDEWESTKNHRVHKHVRDSRLIYKIRGPDDFIVNITSSTTTPLPLVAAAPSTTPQQAAVLPTLANCSKSVLRAKPDGYCGYHSLSLATHKDQKHTKQVIGQMCATLKESKTLYTRMKYVHLPKRVIL